MKNTGRNLSPSTYGFISTIINSDHGPAQDYCWQYCHSSEMDRGIDDFTHPCFDDLWEVMERDDHWDDDGHHDDHHEDLWSILMSSSVGSVSFAFESSYDTKLHILVPRS